MNTADRKTSHPLSTSILVIPDISLIRTISPLMRMVSQSVRWAYVCIKMDMRLLNTARNTDAQKQTGNAAASASSPVHRQNTEDRKSTRLNSSHVSISYAVFCLKKKTVIK